VRPVRPSQLQASRAGDGISTVFGRLICPILFALLVPLIPGKAAAVDGDSLNVTLLDRHFLGQPYDVRVEGTIVFVAMDAGLQAIDVSSPDNPLPLDHIYLPSPAYRIAFSNDRVYVANGESGLTIIDAQNPADLKLLGSLPTSGISRGVFVQGNVAYLAEAGEGVLPDRGLRTIDITNPALPSELGFLPLANGALDVFVSGPTAYVGIGSDSAGPFGLVIVDVTAPASPSGLGFLDTGKPVNDILIQGATALLGIGFPFAGNIVAVDVGNPFSPSVISSYPLADAAYSISLDGTTLQVATGALGVVLLDAGNLTNMDFLGALATDRDTRGVAAGANLAFLGERSYTVPAAFTVVDTAVTSSLSVLSALPYSEATDVALFPGTAYLLNREALAIFDDSVPGGAVQLGTYGPSGADFSALSVDGKTAAVALGRDVVLVDVSNPGAPSALGTATLSQGAAVRPVLVGNTLYVVNGLGVEIFDVTNPSAPSILGSYLTAAFSRDLFVDGSVGYLAVGTEIHFLDLSMPASPSFLGSFDALDTVTGVAVTGSTAVLTAVNNLVVTVDVSNLSSPVELGRLPGSGLRVVTAGTHALIAGAEEGAVLVDIADPSAPAEDGYYDTSGVAVSIASDRTTIFLATGVAQHWECESSLLGSGCSVDVDIQPPGPIEICQGEPLILDGTGTTATGCTGTLLFQWFEDGSPISGETGAAYTIPAGHGLGPYTFRLEAVCEPDPSCTGSAGVQVTFLDDLHPTEKPDTLKIAKLPVYYTLSWELESGSGEFNVHRTTAKTDLPLIYLDAGTIIWHGASLATQDDFTPTAGSVGYYKAFGRGSCSGLSFPP
jgi:hypothetical protein